MTCICSGKTQMATISKLKYFIAFEKDLRSNSMLSKKIFLRLYDTKIK